MFTDPAGFKLCSQILLLGKMLLESKECQVTTFIFRLCQEGEKPEKNRWLISNEDRGLCKAESQTVFFFSVSCLFDRIYFFCLS